MADEKAVLKWEGEPVVIGERIDTPRKCSGCEHFTSPVHVVTVGGLDSLWCDECLEIAQAEHRIREAAREAGPLLLKVLQAVYSEVSFHEAPGIWSIGPRADIPDGLLDLIRKALALATPGKAVRG